MADSDLQIRGGGWGWRVADHSDPEIRRGGWARSEKNFFYPFGTQFGLKIRRSGGGGGGGGGG